MSARATEKRILRQIEKEGGADACLQKRDEERRIKHYHDSQKLAKIESLLAEFDSFRHGDRGEMFLRSVKEVLVS